MQNTERELEIQKLVLDAFDLIADKLKKHAKELDNSMEAAYYLNNLDGRIRIIFYLSQGLK